jgi:hypothetical protein
MKEKPKKRARSRMSSALKRRRPIKRDLRKDSMNGTVITSKTSGTKSINLKPNSRL